MEFQLKHKHAWIINAYLAPISDRGLVACWRGKHSLYRKGYVLRVLWLGLVIRWSYIKAEHRPTYAERTLDETIANARALVATWPEWKRNILRDSASPTVRVPRTPIIIDDSF